jgi:phage/plasmid-like protein (TIGR03299 family)
MLFRGDTGDILHVSKDTYEVIQNQVGMDLMEALLDADKAVLFETGGSTFGGKTCYLTAKVDEPVAIDGDDSAIYPYVVVTWSHDGTAAMQARSTNVRVVCWNTLSLSEAQAKRSGRNFTFRHTKNVKDRIVEAKRAIAGVRNDTADFIELANELAAIAISDAQREAFVVTFVPKPAADVVSDQVLDNINKARAQVRSTFDSPSIPEAHRNTAYGLVLAGGEYLDHLRAYRSSDTYLGRTLLKDDALKARLVPMVRKLVAA